MLKHFFKPASVAVIGASRDPDKVGHAILKNLLEANCKIYPINPKVEELMGLKCYPSVTEVKGRIELAVVSVPSKLVLQVMEECGRKKIDSVVVITAGFKESGREGALLEKELIKTSQKFGIRILGPNCLGIINTHHRLNASFASGMPQRGNIAFFSQSGAIGVAVIDWALRVHPVRSKT